MDRSGLSRDAKKAYRQLYNASIGMRYLTDSNSERTQPTKGRWMPDRDAKALVQADLEVLKDEVNRLLAS